MVLKVDLKGGQAAAGRRRPPPQAAAGRRLARDIVVVGETPLRN